MNRSQTFSLDELRGMYEIAAKNGAGEVCVTDWRPDAACIVLELDPGTDRARACALDDFGDELDVMDVPL